MTDDAAAIECLRRNGYYRLSAYWYPFREIVANKRTDTFLPDSKFQDAVELYNFDKNLKLFLLDAIERVEIAVRVEITLLLGVRNTFVHTDATTFRTKFITQPRPKTSYDSWPEKFDGMVTRKRRIPITLRLERIYTLFHRQSGLIAKNLSCCHTSYKSEIVSS